MRDTPPKPVYDLGATPPLSPSVPRVDVLGWLLASLALGALAACLAMALSWRALPWLPRPAAPLADHAAAAARWAASALSSAWFEADARAYKSYFAALPAAERWGIWLRAGLGALAFCLPGSALARACLTPRDGLSHLRGSTRRSGADAARALNRSLEKPLRARPDHNLAPGVAYPASFWTRHALLVAGTGSGKSTVLRPLIDAVVEANESALIFDPKGEFTKSHPDAALIAPWDSRSLAWDIAADMRNVGDMRRFAAAMIPEAKDPMWSSAARQILVGFMIYLRSTRDSDWGWRDLAQLFSIKETELLPMMSLYHKEAVRAVQRASVTTQGILINLSAFGSSIFDLAEAWGEAPPDRRVSFSRWVAGDGAHRQIILQGHGAYADLTRSCLEGIIGTVSAAVNSVEMDDDDDRKLWFICDECPQAGKIPLRPLLEVGRSRGFRCVLACQDLAQMEEIHGPLMVKAMVSMVGTLIVGRLGQGDTAEQMCKALGSREVERASVSSSYNGGGGAGRSTTLSFTRDELAVYKPSELSSRLGPTADGKGVVMSVITAGVAYELFWPWHPARALRPAHVPAEWTKGPAPVEMAGAPLESPTWAAHAPAPSHPKADARADWPSSWLAPPEPAETSPTRTIVASRPDDPGGAAPNECSMDGLGTGPLAGALFEGAASAAGLSAAELLSQCASLVRELEIEGGPLEIVESTRPAPKPDQSAPRRP